MSPLVLAAVAAMLVPLVTRGSYRRLAETRWNQLGVLFLGLALQVLLEFDIVPESRWHDIGFGLLVASMALILGFCAVNLSHTGMGVVLVGVLANTMAIVVNQGMPVDVPQQWLEESGYTETVKHHLQTPDDSLIPITDIIAVPAPFETVISFGDIIIAVGLVVVVYHASRASSSSRARRRRDDESPDANAPLRAAEADLAPDDVAPDPGVTATTAAAAGAPTGRATDPNRGDASTGVGTADDGDVDIAELLAETDALLAATSPTDARSSDSQITSKRHVEDARDEMDASGNTGDDRVEPASDTEPPTTASAQSAESSRSVRSHVLAADFLDDSGGNAEAVTDGSAEESADTSDDATDEMPVTPASTPPVSLDVASEERAEHVADDVAGKRDQRTRSDAEAAPETADEASGMAAHETAANETATDQNTAEKSADQAGTGSSPRSSSTLSSASSTAESYT